MTSTKKDFLVVTIIGGLVGLLIQPVISNLIANPTLPVRLAFFFGALVFAPFALLVAYFIGKVIPVLYQFAKFGAVGTLNSFVDFGVLNIEILLSGITGGIVYSIFKAVSFLAATTNSFFWNKNWTFNYGGGTNAGKVAKFYTIAIIGGIINVSLASFIVNNVGRPAVISGKLWANIGALIGIFATLLWNFIGYKFLVFKKEEPRATVVDRGKPLTL